MACVNQHNRLFFNNFTMFLLRMTIIALMLSAFFTSIASGIEFSVDDYNDIVSNLKFVISKDGKLFVSKGSRKITLRNWSDPNKRLWSIRWKDELTKSCSEYFLYNESGEPSILLKKQIETKQNDHTKIEVYNKSGKELGSIELTGDLPKNSFSVSPNKRFFGLLYDNSVDIYNSGTQIAKSYTVGLKYAEPDIFQISNNGSAFIFGRRDDLLYYCDMNKTELKTVGVCGKTGLSIYSNAFENSPKKFIVLSENGNVCLIEEETIKKLKININGKILGVYADETYFYVVTSNTLSAYSIENYKLQGEFDVKEYYTKKYGESPNERPFFVKCEFESASNTFILQGSYTINKIFNVKIMK